MKNFEINNFHLIQATVLPWSERYGYRILLKSYRFKQSKYIRWSGHHDTDRTLRVVAVEYLKKLGFDIVGAGELNDDSDIIISSTFEPIK